MRMQDGKHVRPHLVDGQMHGDLAGAFPRALDFIALNVADDQVVHRHHAFADAGACAENPAIIQPDADIPVVGRYPTFLVNQLPDINNVLPVLTLRFRHLEFRLYQAARAGASRAFSSREAPRRDRSARPGGPEYSRRLQRPPSESPAYRRRSASPWR